jgi:hypothetical protein
LGNIVADCELSATVATPLTSAIAVLAPLRDLPPALPFGASGYAIRGLLNPD